MRRALLLALLASAVVPAAAQADRFGGLVGIAPPPVKCSAAPCPFVDGEGAEQRTMANATDHEVRISPHVVRVGEDVTVTISAAPASTSCQGFIPFANFVSSSGDGTATVTCVYRATGATNFTDPTLPGSPSGPGYLVYDRFEGDRDHDYYVFTDEQFELRGKVLRGGVSPPAAPVQLEIRGGSPETTQTVATNDLGEYATVRPAGTYIVTPQDAPGVEPAFRTVNLATHQRAVDFELAAEVVVNRQQDGADSNVGDGVCDADPGQAGPQCPVRAALQESNAGAADVITFQLTGVPDLTVSDGPLPAVTRAVLIDGQTNGVERPAIVRGGDLATQEGRELARRGLRVTAGGSTVRGLDVRGFANQVLVDVNDGPVELRNLRLGTNRAGNDKAPELIEDLEEMHCSPDSSIAVLGQEVACTGVHARTATGLTIEDSVMAFNIGTGLRLDNGAGGVRILRSGVSRSLDGSPLVGAQEQGLAGEADGVTVAASFMDDVAAGKPREEDADTFGPDDADGWTVTGSVLGRLDITGEDNHIGAPGDGNGNLMEDVKIHGDHNVFQHNDVSATVSGESGPIRTAQYAVLVRGAMNQIGGADRAQEGNMIAAGGSGKPLELDDMHLGPDNEILDARSTEGQRELDGGGIGVLCPAYNCHRAALPPDADRGRGNVIQGNTIFNSLFKGGVVVQAPGTVVRGNTIGISDFAGVFVEGAGAIVEDNDIGSVRMGPAIYLHAGTGHRVLGNELRTGSITTPAATPFPGIGIDLGDDTGKVYLGGQGPTPNDSGDFDEGINSLQNYPELTRAELDVDGGLNLAAPPAVGNFEIEPSIYEFYVVEDCAGSRGRAAGPVGRVEQFGQPVAGRIADAAVSGLGRLQPGMGIVATVTTPRAGTSELSPCVTITTPPAAPPTGGTTPPAAGFTPAAAAPAPPRCSLRPGGDAGGLRLVLKCDQNATLTIEGKAKITERAGAGQKRTKAKARTVKLRRATKVVKAGSSATVKLPVPAAVVRAVRRRARVSIAFTATVRSGTTTVTRKATLKRLKAAKRQRRVTPRS